MPGWIQKIVGEGNDVWGYVFAGLSGTLLVAALLLAPQWNTVPTTSDKAKDDDVDVDE